MTITKGSKIYVAGHRGLVGSAVLRALVSRGHSDIVVRTHAELDLTEQLAVRQFFNRERPAAVIMAAALVGGIHANNTRPAEFIHDNLLVQDNVIDAAYRAGVEKFVFLVRAVSTRSSPLSLSRRSISSRVHWSRPTSGTRSPRSPGSKCAKRIVVNTDSTRFL